MKQAKNPIKAVETTVRILKAVNDRDEPNITELANVLDITKGTVHNHLSTLEQNELIVKEGNTFRLSLRFFEYGEQIRNQHKIYTVGIPEVNKLAKETGELANILFEEHGYGVYLYRAKGENALSLDTGVGSRVYLHQTALGKAILAYLPEERVEEIIDHHRLVSSTENTISNREELFEQLEVIRDRQYALDLEERAEGICCVAAPVITNNRVVHGAISIAGPVSRIDVEQPESMLPKMVKNAADVVSINLTYA